MLPHSTLGTYIAWHTDHPFNICPRQVIPSVIYIERYSANLMISCYTLVQRCVRVQCHAATVWWQQPTICFASVIAISVDRTHTHWITQYARRPDFRFHLESSSILNTLRSLALEWRRSKIIIIIIINSASISTNDVERTMRRCAAPPKCRPLSKTTTYRDSFGHKSFRNPCIVHYDPRSQILSWNGGKRLLYAKVRSRSLTHCRQKYAL